MCYYSSFSTERDVVVMVVIVGDEEAGVEECAIVEGGDLEV